MSNIYSLFAKALSDKEKSLLGIGVFPGLREYFNNKTNDYPPNPAHWNVTEVNGVVAVKNTTAEVPGYIVCAETVNGIANMIATTNGKVMISQKEPVTTIHVKSRIKFNYGIVDQAHVGIGFAEGDAAIIDMASMVGAAFEVASIIQRETNGVFAYASDGVAVESTDLNAYVADNTWFDVEIVISGSDVKYYINGVLRATHSTNVPSSSWQLVIGAKYQNEIGSKLCAQYVNLWAE